MKRDESALDCFHGLITELTWHLSPKIVLIENVLAQHGISSAEVLWAAARGDDVRQGLICHANHPNRNRVNIAK